MNVLTSQQNGTDMLIHANRLREKRKKLGLRQEDLAERCDLNIRQIQRYEKGDSRPSVKSLLRLAAVLNVSIEWLLGLVDKERATLRQSDLRPDQLEVLAIYESGDVQRFAALVRKKWRE